MPGRSRRGRRSPVVTMKFQLLGGAAWAVAPRGSAIEPPLRLLRVVCAALTRRHRSHPRPSGSHPRCTGLLTGPLKKAASLRRVGRQTLGARNSSAPTGEGSWPLSLAQIHLLVVRTTDQTVAQDKPGCKSCPKKIIRRSPRGCMCGSARALDRPACSRRYGFSVDTIAWRGYGLSVNIC